MATEVLTQACSQCSQVKDLTTANFGVNTREATGFRTICKSCFSQNRSAKKTQAVRDLKNQERVVKAAKKALEHPEGLSMGQLHKAQQIVGLAEKKRGKLLAKIAEQRQAEEAAKFQQAANPPLARVRALGSELFAGDGTLLPVSERPAQLTRLKAALETLNGPADDAARAYLQTSIQALEKMLANTAERESFLVQQEQDTLNERVSRRVIGKLYDIFLPQIRAAITAEAKISLREKIRDRKKKLMAMAKTATGKDSSGAEKVVVAKTVADALEKLALMLYSGTKAPLPSDTLGNLQSRIDAEQANAELLERAEAERRQYWDDLKASDPEQFEKESKSLVRQIKGDDYWSQMQREAARRLIRKDPVEAARLAMLALQPRNVTPKPVVYVIQEGKRETWLWPSGALVKRGDDGEVVYDARMKAWCMAPAPIGTELEPITAKPFQKQELIQDPMDCDEDGAPKWKWVPEGSTGIWEQQNTGEFKRIDNPSPWTQPERLEFRRAEAPASAAHDQFRHGKWFTQAEVEEAAAADAANPPTLLPPLPRFSVADSIAVSPASTAADKAKDAKPLETVWQRSDRLRREKAEREAALLRGEPVAV